MQERKTTGPKNESMKKTLLVALAVLSVGVATSKADVAFGISFGTPRHCAPVYRAPVCVTPAPVYVAPAPVYVAPAPVCAPVYVEPVYRPVYPTPVYAPACPTPVYVQPRYHGGYGHGYYRSGYSHHRPSHGGSVRISW